MIQRGISEGDVRTAITQGAKSRYRTDIIASYRYFSVIYVQRKNRILVKTVTLR